uniref:ANK_REP_REGION domain-containing protein n=1 Tax=Hymenolepis diminuta TaxID=6216 RepID=A0A0R3SGW6_HYMDI
LDMASLLLANDRDPKKSTNRESRCGFTPLHLAAQEGNADMVGLLLLNGADAENKANNGVTPMHLAALEDHVTVAQQLVQEGAKVTDVTQAGYTPLHTACYAGRLNMARFLIALSSSDINAKTCSGFTPLHLAAQQGHSDIVYLLLERGADPNAKNKQGLTPAEIARHQHYLAIFDTLKTITTVVDDWEETRTPGNEEVILDLPEITTTNKEAAEAEESDDECMVHPHQPDYTSSYPSQYQAEYVRTSTQHPNSLHPTEPYENELIWGEMEYLSQPMRDHLDAEWEMEIEPTLSAGKKPLAGGFLVSFLVDARGGLLESKRYPGLRFIIPPNASIGPLRIICRLLRYPSYAVQPPLNDGEGLACRLIEVGPVGVRFNSPILFEVPYCASVRGNQREIIVLRSENGEVWKEHPVDNTDQAVQDSLGAYFADAIPSTELKKRRVHRILTNSIPQYFALVTRTRQDLILVGPDGCTLTSTVDPRVKVTFPRGALQKKIRVGLQVQTVDHRLVEACLGSPRFAVSPIVTIEPRRRKFHRPIVVFIPLPKVAGKGEHQGGGKNQTPDLSTVRLLCSITGGTAQAIWEDITGSSPFSLQKDCVSFTTTVSARYVLL